MNLRTCLLVMALVVGACGSAGDPLGQPSDLPALQARCGPVSMSWPVPEPPMAGLPPFLGELDDYVDEQARVEFDLETLTDWSVVEESESSLSLLGTIEDGSGYRYARFEKNEDGWRATSWGGCHIEATADGYGVATFKLDPENPPDPDSSSFDVLANERDCASGQAPEGREVVPVVVELVDYIEVTIMVESISGDATCPSNPDFVVTIELDEPLGDREIRDVGLQPAETVN